jgi:hypothetical protein
LLVENSIASLMISWPPAEVIHVQYFSFNPTRSVLIRKDLPLELAFDGELTSLETVFYK